MFFYPGVTGNLIARKYFRGVHISQEILSPSVTFSQEILSPPGNLIAHGKLVVQAPS